MEMLCNSHNYITISRYKQHKKLLYSSIWHFTINLYVTIINKKHELINTNFILCSVNDVIKKKTNVIIKILSSLIFVCF